MDPFVLANSGAGKNNSMPTNLQCFPTVEAALPAYLVAYLVSQTSFVTTQQFKAHKSMKAYNQFASGWVKDVYALTINQKSVLTGRVSYHN